jgi:hypothetical protein
MKGKFSLLPLRFAEGEQGGEGKLDPADDCRAMCLSFRSLDRLS